ncbi:hypothetical protein RRG08_052634 [Elysia crispata]|uniref:Uncharacterized protein n=1 Tax=Elysia crispata TaxID=231223 RepID=A0AAE1DZ83_9GAST|nr:hypothetical protein RRG08_052634 [Elysia crispata]
MTAAPSSRRAEITSRQPGREITPERLGLVSYINHYTNREGSLTRSRGIRLKLKDLLHSKDIPVTHLEGRDEITEVGILLLVASRPLGLEERGDRSFISYPATPVTQTGSSEEGNPAHVSQALLPSFSSPSLSIDRIRSNVSGSSRKDGEHSNCDANTT